MTPAFKPSEITRFLSGFYRHGFRSTGVIFCAFFAFAAMAFAGTYSGGSGSTDNPYQLANAADLIALSETPNDWSRAFILTADIDMDPNLPGGKVFDRAPIAPDTSPAEGFQGQPFSGSFDGKGFAIRNLTIRCGDGVSYIGLFGNLGGGMQEDVVCNLYLIDSRIDVGGEAKYVGLLAGAGYGIVSNCHVSGIIHAGPDASFLGGLSGIMRSSLYLCSTDIQLFGTGGLTDVGGLAGVLEGSNILNDILYCESNGLMSINGSAVNVGGLLGRLETTVLCYGDECMSFVRPSIDSSFSQGLITVGAGSMAVGGLVGHVTISVDWGGELEACASTREVVVGEGSGFVGGLVGKLDYARNGSTVSLSYAAGSITAGTSSHDIGGLVGGGGGKVWDSFWDVEASGQASSAGGTGKTTAEMMTKATFTAARWNFTWEWAICEGTNYPRFKWQIPTTDWVCPDGVGIEDLVYLAQRWLAATPETVGAADGNGDGKVNLEDFEILAANWMRE
jgi:hypothetical protein